MESPRDDRRQRMAGMGPGAMLGSAQGSGQAFTAAIFQALTSGCDCKSCQLLRRAAQSIGDELLEDMNDKQAGHSNTH